MLEVIEKFIPIRESDMVSLLSQTLKVSPFHPSSRQRDNLWQTRRKLNHQSILKIREILKFK
jgi:hypothetical protein